MEGGGWRGPLNQVTAALMCVSSLSPLTKSLTSGIFLINQNLSDYVRPRSLDSTVSVTHPLPFPENQI